jgi:CHAT domain
VGEVLVILARWIGLLALAALLWLAAPMPAAADLSSVGGEAAVGANGTGEACRARLAQDDAARGLQRFNLYCDGWTVASGTLFRFRVTREFTPERLLTDSTLQRGYETRLGACGAVEPTTLGDGTAAALRQCPACNTAGPDGTLGGESLSGLARAFFYAGARALLVSHWAVASGPTVDLTTGMFAKRAPVPASDGAPVPLAAVRRGRRWRCDPVRRRGRWRI